jgi:hypothetical protein
LYFWVLLLSVHRLNRPDQYPAQRLVPEFSSKYQAPNTRQEALNNDVTLQKSLPSDVLLRYHKLRTVDSDGDTSQSSEEKSSKISGFDNLKAIKSSTHQNSHWHRKLSTEYHAITGKQNTNFSSGDQHYSEILKKLTHNENQLGALDVGTNIRMKRAVHPYNYYLEVQKKDANNQRRADKVKKNSLHPMKSIYRFQTKHSFKSGDGLEGSNAMNFEDTAESEAEMNKRIEDSIHSKIEALKAMVEKEEENARRNINTEIMKTGKQSLSHINGAYDIKQQVHNFHPEQELHSEEDYEGETYFPSEIRDDASINTHGHKYSFSENEDEAEKIMRTEHSTHPKIEALKAALRKEIAKEESANTNREISKTAEHSLSHNNGARVIKQQVQNFHPEQELHSEEDYERETNSVYEIRDDASSNRFSSSKKKYEAEKIRTETHIQYPKDDTNINKRYHRFSSSANEDEDKPEKNMRIKHSVHSKIEALKAAVKKEIAMEESARRNANRELRETAEQPLSHNNSEHVIKQQVQNFHPEQELHSEEDYERETNFPK